MSTRDEHLTLMLERSPLRTLPFEVWHGPIDLEAALAAIQEPFTVGVSQIPASTVYTIQRGDIGLVAWAVQKALNLTTGSQLILDSEITLRDDQAIRNFQLSHDLYVDGIFGPISSISMAEELEDLAPAPIPKGLLYGQMKGESGLLIGAVNWSVPGGVDCSLTQRRLTTEHYGDEVAEHRVFNGGFQTKLSANGLASWTNSYLHRRGCPTYELAARCSAQRHNYPAGADAVANLGSTGLSQYYYAPQEWVERIGVHFADGTPVRTPWNWMQFYAFGAPEFQHEGLVTRYVEDWSL